MTVSRAARSTREGHSPILVRVKAHPKRASVRLEARLEEAIVLALFDLANHLQRRGERLAEVAALTTQQWLVLLQIAGDPNFPGSERQSSEHITASEIARTRGLSRPAMSAVIGALVRRGLVREEADPADRRRRFLAITAAGAKAVESIEGHRRAANARLLGGITPAERKTLHGLLEHCLGVLWDVHEDEQTARARRRLATQSSS